MVLVPQKGELKLSVSVEPPLLQLKSEPFQLQLEKFPKDLNHNIPDCTQEQTWPLQGFGRCRDAMNGGRLTGISLSVPPQTQKGKQKEAEGGMGVINLPNTDVGPKEGNRLRHVFGHAWE